MILERCRILLFGEGFGFRLVGSTPMMRRGGKVLSVVLFLGCFVLVMGGRCWCSGCILENKEQIFIQAIVVKGIFTAE